MSNVIDRGARFACVSMISFIGGLMAANWANGGKPKSNGVPKTTRPVGRPKGSTNRAN